MCLRVCQERLIVRFPTLRTVKLSTRTPPYKTLLSVPNIILPLKGMPHYSTVGPIINGACVREVCSTILVHVHTVST